MVLCTIPSPYLGQPFPHCSPGKWKSKSQPEKEEETARRGLADISPLLVLGGGGNIGKSRRPCPKFFSTTASASNPACGRVTKKQKPWIEGRMAISHWGYSLTGCPGMYAWARLEKWNAERAMMMLWVTLRLHKVEKDTPSPKISLGFTEERGKLNTRDTDIELLCLGPGWHCGRDSSSHGWTDQGSVQKKGSGRALRVYCTSEKQWAKSAKWAQNVLKKQLTGVTRLESTVDASSNPAKGKPKINSREGGEDPIGRTSTYIWTSCLSLSVLIIMRGM